jgi:hypothetical protein
MGKMIIKLEFVYSQNVSLQNLIKLCFAGSYDLGGGRFLSQERWNQIRALPITLQVLAVLREGYPANQADEILSAYSRTGKAPSKKTGGDKNVKEAYPLLCRTLQ